MRSAVRLTPNQGLHHDGEGDGIPTAAWALRAGVSGVVSGQRSRRNAHPETWRLDCNLCRTHVGGKHPQ